MLRRLDRFSLFVGLVVLVLAVFATTGSLGEVINRSSLLTGLALGVAALAVAASALNPSPRFRRSPGTPDVQGERQNPEAPDDAGA